MTNRDQVYFDISVNRENIGRVVFQLFNDITPITCENFKILCTRKVPDGYQKCSFHRIITNFMAQGGDFVKGDGTGGKSIYGNKFSDQNFIVKHDQPYLLSMANAGKNTNGSQFFVTFVKCPWLDGKHVVFGKVIDGQQVIDYLNKNTASNNGKPSKPVTIQDSGILYESNLNAKQITKNPAFPNTSEMAKQPFEMVKQPKKRQKVFFDIKVGQSDEGHIGKIVFQLFYDITPKTCENFKVLCTRQGTEGYKGNIFHRIIKDFMAQGGDFTNKNGTGGKSIYGKKFDDQNFILKHDQPYLLSMANAGKNTNGSQFFITFVPCPWLDGKHVVFGKVVQGKQVVDYLNKNTSSANGKPTKSVTIADSGVIQ